MNKVYRYTQLMELFHLSEQWEGLTEGERIDRAGQGIVTALQRLPRVNLGVVYVFAGYGQNGAYALATARYLHERGIEAYTYLFYRRGEVDPAVQLELDKCDAAGIHLYKVYREFSGIEENIEGACLVDGLSGRELYEPLQAPYADLVTYINELRIPTISIDLPSGLIEESSWSQETSSVVRARHTIAIEALSPAHLLRANADYLGTFECLSLGISQRVYDEVDSSHHLISDSLLIQALNSEDFLRPSADKGSVLLVGGSAGRYGHLLLAARAAAAAAVGAISVHTMEEACLTLQMTEPELICSSAGRSTFVEYPNLEQYHALALGLASSPEALEEDFVLRLIERSAVPIVCAGAVALLLIEQPQHARRLSAGSVLVLSEADQEQLFGSTTMESERLTQALALARSIGLVVVLLGYYSRVCCPSGFVYTSAVGHAVLQRPSSVEMQVATIAALIARGYDMILACTMACYLYVRSADLCSVSFGNEGYRSSELLSRIPEVFQQLYDEY